jgi:hypothetical protein
MAGRPKTRAKQEALHQLALRENFRGYREQDPDTRANTLTALKSEILKKGIVEHNIQPEDALQRAIDDTTGDYLLLRSRIRAEIGDDSDRLQEFFDHELYPEAERLKSQMAQLSTIALQYKLADRNMRLDESRTALLAFTLQRTLEQLGVEYEVIRRVPGLMMKNLGDSEHAPKIDLKKAEALAEILGNDAEIELNTIDSTSEQVA